MTTAEIETEVSNIIAAARLALTGGDLSAVPLLGSGKRHVIRIGPPVPPADAARRIIEDGWDDLTDSVIASDADHWDTQAARLLAAAAEMNLGITDL